MNDTMQSFKKTEMKFVSPEASTVEIYNLMKKNNIHHLPVLENGQAVGIISDRDVSFVDKAGEAFTLTARQIMTSSPVTVDELTTIPHALKLMIQNKINSILIKDQTGHISGIFTSTDAMKLLADQY